MATQLAAPTLSEESAEAHVLGSMLIDSSIHQQVKAKLSAADFYTTKHSWIYAAILETGDPCDVFTVGYALKSAGRFDECGGDAYLFQLMGDVPTALNVGRYAQIVADLAERRRLAAATQEIARAVFDVNKPVNTVYGSAIDLLSQAATRRATTHTSMSETAMEALTEYEETRQRKGQLKGITCGVRDIDTLTGGWQPGRLITIAGRPGAGKSVLMAQSALRAAQLGHGVLMYSLEMSGPETVLRMAKNASNIGYGVGMEHTLTDEQDGKIRKAIADITRLPLSIRYAGSIDQILSECEIEHRNGTLQLLVVDQLQNLSAEKGGRMNRDTELGLVTRALKQLSMRLGIAVLMGSAMNRTAEGIAPTLASLRETGSIESDSDQVIGLHQENPQDQPNVVSAMVLKNRIGQTGKATVFFNKASHRFGDLSRDKIAL